MTDPLALYRELVIEHSRSTKYTGTLPSATCSATLHNPLCGDTITVHLEVNDAGIITNARYEAQGCAIAKAMASMMSERIIGQAVAQAKSWSVLSQAAVTGDDQLGFHELTAMIALPARRRCATLPWDTLGAALQAASSTEA